MPKKANFKSERADFGPERGDFRFKRVDLGRFTYGHMDRRTDRC